MVDQRKMTASRTMTSWTKTDPHDAMTLRTLL